MWPEEIMLADAINTAKSAAHTHTHTTPTPSHPTPSVHRERLGLSDRASTEIGNVRLGYLQLRITQEIFSFGWATR